MHSQERLSPDYPEFQRKEFQREKSSGMRARYIEYILRKDHWIKTVFLKSCCIRAPFLLKIMKGVVFHLGLLSQNAINLAA